MDDLTNNEVRAVLTALRRHRETLGRQFDAAGIAEPVHAVETMDTLDSAAHRLGGDPAEHLYGAPRYRS